MIYNIGILVVIVAGRGEKRRKVLGRLQGDQPLGYAILGNVEKRMAERKKYVAVLH